MKLSKGVLYSIIAHVALVLAMIIQVVFYPSEALDLSRAIRVDMIDLPDKITSQPIPEDNSKLPEKKTAEPVAEPEEKKPEPTPEPKPEPKVAKEEPKPKLPEKKEKPADEAININKAKSKQKDALNKLKAAAAIEKLKEEESKKAETKSKQVFKGRILSAGTSITGLDKLQSDSYLTQLDGRIKANWSLPQWLIGKPLRARVHIKFDEAGNILFKKITQSSGNQTYDEYCLLAIDKATPLPKVPEKFSTVYKVDGVTIGFPD